MRLAGLQHVRFQVRDLDRVEVFATDFGLIVQARTDGRLVMRTRGSDLCAYVADRGDADSFTGLAFEVADEAVLAEAVDLHGALELPSLDLPGGGRAVGLTDPDGNDVLLVHGCACGTPEEGYPELQINTPFLKQRLGRNQHSRERGPARLWRLGHIGLFVKDFAASAAWYGEKQGLIGSDIYHVPGQPI